MSNTHREKEEITTELIRFILTRKTVHYQDIMEYTKKSRKTVAKYLDYIDDRIMGLSFDVNLIRKRNVGIYFKGNVNQLLAYYNVNLQIEPREKRQLKILEYLLNNNKPVITDDLADKFFVSKSTLERDLKELKRKYGLVISDNLGISINKTESKLRMLMSNLVQKNLRKEIKQDEQTDDYILDFNIPPELTGYIDRGTLSKTRDILREFNGAVNNYINEYEYTSLIIHIAIAIKRIRKGEYINDTNDMNETNILPATNVLVELIEKKFNCDIPISEQRYLNLHVIAIEGGAIDVERDPSVDKQLVSFLKANLNEYDDLLIKNLVLHLMSTIKRGEFKVKINNPYKKEIKSEFPKAVDLAAYLIKNLNKCYPVLINEDEICYIALHFESYIERKKNNGMKKVTVVIVCSTGYGTAAFLKQRLKIELGFDIAIIKSISVDELMKNGVEADLIISTIPIKSSRNNVVQVSPLINDSEIELLEKVVRRIKEKKRKYVPVNNFFIKLIKKNCIISNSGASTPNDAIKEIVMRLEKNGYVTDKMYNAALSRENLSSTDLGNVAIPHGNISQVKKSVIGVLTCKNAIDWGEGKVRCVFFMALNKDVSNEIDDIYSHFYNLIKDSKKLDNLNQYKEINDIYNYLKEV